MNELQLAALSPVPILLLAIMLAEAFEIIQILTFNGETP